MQRGQAVRRKDWLFINTRFAMPRHDERGEQWRDPEWVHYRIHVYKQLTLASLLRQSDRNFSILFECCEESRPVITPYIDDLQQHGVNVVFDGGAEIMAAASAQYTDFSLLRIDSDDMYGQHAVCVAKRCLQRRRAMLFCGGFWWHIQKRIVRQWIKPSPPFYAVRRRRCEIGVTDDFMGDRLRKNGRLQGHSLFRRVFRPVIAPGMFCVCHHGYNRRGGHGYGKRRFSPGTVLPHFGVGRQIWESQQLSIPERVPA